MRVWLFRLAAVGLGVGLIGGAEGVLRLLPSLAPPPFLVTLADGEDGRLRQVNPRYPERFFFEREQGKYIARGRFDAPPFLESSSSRPFRVLFVGASTVRGYPYPRRLAAASFLDAMLADACPETGVQVFNLGMTALASFAVVQVLQDAMALEPDLVVVYTGHNEFYGIYGVGMYPTPLFNRLHYALMGLRLTRLLRLGLDSFHGDEVSRDDLVEIMGRRGNVALDSAQRSAARRHLRENLRRAARLCGERRIPVIFCTLTANEAGFAPAAVQESGLAGDAAAAWQQWVADAAEQVLGDAVTTAAAAEALEALRQAAALGEENAWVWYLRGRVLAVLGRPREANHAFRQARELDAMPWRAPRAHSEVIRAVAGETGAGLADVEHAFERASPPEGVGWSLVIDHVHPSLKGQILLARTVLETMAQAPEKAGGLDIAPGRLRSDDEYREQLGDLPVTRVRVYRTMGELLSWPPMDRYNAHNANWFKELAEQVWREELVEGERRGLQKRMLDKGEGPLELDVADQLFAAGDLARARQYYAAARREEPFATLGDLWAATQWARSVRLVGEEFSPGQRGELREALRRCAYTLPDGKNHPHLLDLIRGQLHYYLGEHEPALRYLEDAFAEREIREKYVYVFFPLLAEELVRAGRGEDARRYALGAGGRRGDPRSFLQLVENMVRAGTSDPSW